MASEIYSALVFSFAEGFQKYHPVMFFISLQSLPTLTDAFWHFIQSSLMPLFQGWLSSRPTAHFIFYH